MPEEVEPQEDLKRKCIFLQTQQEALAGAREAPTPACHMGADREKEKSGFLQKFLLWVSFLSHCIQQVGRKKRSCAHLQTSFSPATLPTDLDDPLSAWAYV